MSFSFSVIDGESIISSGSRLTIENASDFLNIIREGFESSDRIAIDFEPSVEIDITGLQLLCSACRSAAGAGKTFFYKGLQPQALTDIIKLCGAERNSACKQNSDSTCIWFGGVN